MFVANVAFNHIFLGRFIVWYTIAITMQWPIKIFMLFMLNWLMYVIHSFLVQFISLFTPPITSYFVYSIVHVGVFLANFYLMSLFVLLYVHYIFTFYPDQSANIDIRSLRWKTLLWKFLLTILSLLLSFLVPIEEMPMPFQILLTKGKQCDR